MTLPSGLSGDPEDRAISQGWGGPPSFTGGRHGRIRSLRPDRRCRDRDRRLFLGCVTIEENAGKAAPTGVQKMTWQVAHGFAGVLFEVGHVAAAQRGKITRAGSP